MLDTLERTWREDSELFFLALFVIGLGWLIVKRRRTGLAVLAAVVVAGVPVVALQGDDGPSEETKAAMRRLAAERQERRDGIVAAIRARDLPPVALEMFPRHGLTDADIIPRPGGDGDQKDVIHLGGDGTSGRKLAWDLDGDGRISRDEREITERELWIATESHGPPPPEPERPDEREPA